MSKILSAADSTTVNSDKRDITGTNFPDDDKRGLDVNMLGSVEGSFSPSGLKKGGKVTIVTVGANDWTPLPGNALTDRNAMSIQNQGDKDVKLNYDPAVAGYNGILLKAEYERYYDITDAITIYAKTESGTVNLAVEELA